jgi:hypothetical protein
MYSDSLHFLPCVNQTEVIRGKVVLSHGTSTAACCYWTKECDIRVQLTYLIGLEDAVHLVSVFSSAPCFETPSV